MRTAIVLLFCLGAGVLGLQAQRGPKTLDIYYIDTEGGQSTLFVSPTGESLLVDTGNGGDRDLTRIVETLKTAGLSRIDHMWTTHYHGDHVGALLALAGQFPMVRFYDHGKPNANDRIVSAQFITAYEALSEGKRTIVKPGDRVRMTGLDIIAVSSATAVLQTNLPGAGQPNAACAGVPRKDESAYFDPDNGDSAGFVLTFGNFRTVDLGDLTWNAELDLMCPTNRIGTADVYLTSHHGLAVSGSPALVRALQPRVAIMNNGTRKGGARETFTVLHESPGLEDLWQLHWSYNAGLDNTPATFIANIDDAATIAGVLTAPAPAARGTAPAGPGGAPNGAAAAGAAAPGLPQPQGQQQPAAAPPPGPARGAFPGGAAAAHSPAYLIKVSAQQDGTFTVTNTRTGFTKSYTPRRAR
jgi:beta-lactamase superfamily II metal-dependent hydrolase